jgi:hypothetical protein
MCGLRGGLASERELFVKGGELFVEEVRDLADELRGTDGLRRVAPPVQSRRQNRRRRE